MTIPYSTLRQKWKKSPEFRKEFDALNPEFKLVREMMKAFRGRDTEREEQGAETRNEKSKVRKHGTRRARCGDTEREEQGAEPRNEEKQDGSITRYVALPRNGTSQALHHE